MYYKGQLGRATALSVTPEMERVKKNQENISSASRFLHFGLLQRMRPVLFTHGPFVVSFCFSHENETYSQETFVIHAVSPRVMSDDSPELMLHNLTSSLHPSIGASRCDQCLRSEFSFKLYYAYLNNDSC